MPGSRTLMSDVGMPGSENSAVIILALSMNVSHIFLIMNK